MALAASILTSGTDTTDGTTRTTASFTATAGSLLIAICAGVTGGTTPVPTVTSTLAGSLTIANIADKVGTSLSYRVTAHKIIGHSGGSGTVTFTSGVTLTNAAWHIIEVTGGPNTASPLAQAVVTWADASAAPNMSLGSAPTSGMCITAVARNVGSTSFTPEAGWTTAAQGGFTPSWSCLAGYNTANDQSFNCDAGGGATLGFIMEIAAAAAAPASSPLDTRRRRMLPLLVR